MEAECGSHLVLCLDCAILIYRRLSEFSGSERACCSGRDPCDTIYPAKSEGGPMSDITFELVNEPPDGTRLDHAPVKTAALANPDQWVRVPSPERKNYSISKLYRKCGFQATVRKGVVYVKARPAA